MICEDDAHPMCLRSVGGLLIPRASTRPEGAMLADRETVDVDVADPVACAGYASSSASTATFAHPRWVLAARRRARLRATSSRRSGQL